MRKIIYKEHLKKPIWGILMGVFCLFAATLLVLRVAPGSMWIELLFLTLLSFGIFMLISLLSRKLYIGVIACIVTIGLLLMQRLQITNPISVGLLLTIVGIICLVN